MALVLCWRWLLLALLLLLLLLATPLIMSAPPHTHTPLSAATPAAAPTYKEACSLPTWQYLLVSAARVQHPLQLQLAQLALLHYWLGVGIKKGVAAGRQRDGTAAVTKYTSLLVSLTSDP